MPAHPLNDLNQRMDKWVWSSDLFWSKVQKRDNDCWTWLGSTGPSGPLFGIYKLDENNKRKPRMMSARRVMFAEHHGHWLNPDEPIYHGCGNRSCMNPDHFTNIRPKHNIYENYREQHDRS